MFGLDLPRRVGTTGPKSAARLGGKPGYTEPPAGWDAIDPKTGEQVGIDKGWGYMPGATAKETARAIERKAASLPVSVAAALMEDIDMVWGGPLRSALDDVVARALKDATAGIEYGALVGDDGIVWTKRGDVKYWVYAARERRAAGAGASPQPSGRVVAELPRPRAGRKKWFAQNICSRERQKHGVRGDSRRQQPSGPASAAQSV